MDLSRRELLTIGGLALAGSAVTPSPLRAQAPKRGGTLSLRLWDPPHFDIHGAGGLSYKLHILATFTHGRLVRHKVGPSVTPGTFQVEPDLAESWTQTNEATYVFKLRRGVKWQPKPPANGREFTADDVVYTVNRFLTNKGNANAYLLKSVDKVEAVDKYTVKFALKEPYAWFLDILASPMVVGMSHISMRTDQKPFSDVRVRHAISHAIDRQGIIDATAEGVGVFNPAVPAALKEWSLPINQLGEGAKYFKYDPAEAKRLLAAAGYPNGFHGSVCFTTYGSTVLVDAMQIVLKNLKDVGIEGKLEQKEYGDHLRSARDEPLPLRRDQPARLSRHPGREPGRRLLHRAHQSGRGHALRGPRPADPVLTSPSGGGEGGSIGR